MSEPHVTVGMSVNGRAVALTVPARMTVADLLREELELTGTHLGCEHGVCGACTVLVDGRSMRSCILYAGQMEGARITTIEGLSPPDGSLNPIQQALHERHGLQCGFCTPGFVVTIHELLGDNPNLTEAEVREALSGNVCRCTGYQGLVAAVLDVARDMSHAATKN
jgi:aerobic-type carbon monoxide dehydrogenase small subunit (CoxS/CutS family)